MRIEHKLSLDMKTGEEENTVVVVVVVVVGLRFVEAIDEREMNEVRGK